MSQPIKNMRIHFYGVRGSGSTFSESHENAALHDLMDYQLLKKVFDDLAQHADKANQLDHALGELLGGPVNQETILNYRKRLNIPKPRVYGGCTTCLHIETPDGHDIILDCGSAFRNCAKNLQVKWGDQKERHLHIFGTHSHLDHTEGFHQAAVCFDPRNTLHIYSNYHFLCSLDSYLGIFSRSVPDELLGVHTPIIFSKMPAKFRGVEIRDPDKPPPKADNRPDMDRTLHDLTKPIKIGQTRITPFWVYHPIPCLAYKIEHGGKKFVFCTDHELRHGPDPSDPKQRASEEAEARLMEHAKDADVLYRDGQFLRSDYEGISGISSSDKVPRLDWGHSCVEDVQDMAFKCRVKHTYVGHHDPNRGWSELDQIDKALARSCEDRDEKIELACAGTVIDL